MAEHVQLRSEDARRVHKQEVQLGGVAIRLWARPIAQPDRWYLEIRDLADQLIVGGIACVPGVNLLLPYKHLAIPQGSLYCLANDKLPPTFSTLDVSARVIYQ